MKRLDRFGDWSTGPSGCSSSRVRRTGERTSHPVMLLKTALVAAGVVCASMFITVSAFAQPRAFTLDDLARVVRVSDPQIAADGRSIAVVVGRANLEEDRWESQIDLVDIATHAVR